MLPITKQATSTEVEGETTVEVTGTDEQGTPLEEAVQQPEEQTADSQAEEAQPEKGETDAGTVPEKAPRVERRTEKLIDTLKAKTDEVSALRAQLDSFKAQPQQAAPQLPPWLQPQPQEEVTWDQYQAQVADTARNLVKSEITAFQSKVSQYEDFKEDLTEVEAKYSILKEGSDEYDPGKAKVIAELYQKASAADPNLRLGNFVESVMSFHQAGQETGKKELKTSVIKRDAEAAVTPTQSGKLPSDNLDWDSMNLSEKEAWMKANGYWDK